MGEVSECGDGGGVGVAVRVAVKMGGEGDCEGLAVRAACRGEHEGWG